MTHKLLIVDDELPNLRLLERLFSSEYECLTASSAESAIRLLEQHDIAILITDQRMPGMSGIELLKATATLRPHMVRILLTGYTDVEALVEAINSGLVYMYFTKPWNNGDLKLKVSRARDHYENNKKRESLTSANDRLRQRLAANKVATTESLGEMLRARDEHQHAHAIRVQSLALLIAEKMNLKNMEKEELAIAAMLHGLGTIDLWAVASRSDSQIDRKLTQAECEAKLLNVIFELTNVAELIKSQSENFDGTGSPAGLRREEIPLAARILRVADEYDSLLQPENSAAMLPDEAIRFLVQGANRQFDPDVIDALSKLETNPSRNYDGSKSQMTPLLKQAIPA